MPSEINKNLKIMIMVFTNDGSASSKLSANFSENGF